MYLTDGNDVMLRMTQAEYATFLLAMGYATASVHSTNDRVMFRSFIEFMNSVNNGNPNYVPYLVAEAAGEE